MISRGIGFTADIRSLDTSHTPFCRGFLIVTGRPGICPPPSPSSSHTFMLSIMSATDLTCRSIDSISFPCLVNTSWTLALGSPPYRILLPMTAMRLCSAVECCCMTFWILTSRPLTSAEIFVCTVSAYWVTREAIRLILETMAWVRAMISWARLVMDCEVYCGGWGC